jgi:hypothetical protein
MPGFPMSHSKKEIFNGHSIPPLEGEDFQMFEQDLRGKNTEEHSANSKIGTLRRRISRQRI